MPICTACKLLLSNNLIPEPLIVERIACCSANEHQGFGFLYFRNDKGKYTKIVEFMCMASINAYIRDGRLLKYCCKIYGKGKFIRRNHKNCENIINGEMCNKTSNPKKSMKMNSINYYLCNTCSVSFINKCKCDSIANWSNIENNNYIYCFDCAEKEFGICNIKHINSTKNSV